MQKLPIELIKEWIEKGQGLREMAGKLNQLGFSMQKTQLGYHLTKLGLKTKNEPLKNIMQKTTTSQTITSKLLLRAAFLQKGIEKRQRELNRILSSLPSQTVTNQPTATPTEKIARRYKMSVDARKRIIAAQKLRWATFHKQKEQTQKPKKALTEKQLQTLAKGRMRHQENVRLAKLQKAATTDIPTPPSLEYATTTP